MWDSMERHLALYEARGEPCVIEDGKIWRRYREGIMALGPFNLDYSVSPSVARKVMSRLGGQFVMTTNGFSGGPAQGEWYAVICQEFTPLEAYTSKRRSEIRRGLRNCQVRRIDADYLIAHGYEVFLAAYDRYAGRGGPSWDEAAFQKYVRLAGQYDDVVHFWGVFHNDRFVAFGLNDIFDRIEAMYFMIKIRPDALDLYPVYALLYAMDEYYLDQQGFEYVNDGWRAVVHQTGIQDFLVKKFNFRRQYSRLDVHYAPWLKAAVTCAYPLRGLLGKVSPRARSLFELERLRRSCRSCVAAPADGR